MNVRSIKRSKPYPREYTISASVLVPEFIGPFGFPMDSVRVKVRGSCQTGSPHHSVCMRRLSEARDSYLAQQPALAMDTTPATANPDGCEAARSARPASPTGK